jgi:hypothetical protein
VSRARTRTLLAAVIAVELVAGGLLVADRLTRVAPPAPDLSDVDPATAAELRALSANCQTADRWSFKFWKPLAQACQKNCRHCW